MDQSFLIFYIIGIGSVLGVSLMIFFIALRYMLKMQTWLLYVLVWASVYLLIAQYLKYRSFHFYADFSHWSNLLFNISLTGKPISHTVQFLVPGGENYLSIHFVPLFYLLAIPFKFLPYNETLIILNYILMASSAIPLYKLALWERNDKTFAWLTVALLLWYPTFQYIVLYEFEMLRLGIPIIFWMLYFWRKNKIAFYYLFVLLAILVREEVGLTIMMFGLYLLFIEKRTKVGCVTASFGLAAFVVITRIIMPSFSTSSSYKHIALGLFSAFGNNFNEILMNILRHPNLVLSVIFDPLKLANIFMYFLPLLFIPLLAPLVLISTLSNFGIGMLSRSVTHVSYMLYYMAAAIPFIFYGFIKGWPKFLILLKTFVKKNGVMEKGIFDSAAMAAVLAAILVTNVFFGPSPISLQFWFKNLTPAPLRTQDFHYSVYKIIPHHRQAKDFYRLIPDSAIVSAEQSLAPGLYTKKGVMVFPQLESLDGKVKADYVFIDKKNPIKTGIASIKGSYDGLRKNPQYYYDLIEKDTENWKLVKSEDGYFLYKRIDKN